MENGPDFSNSDCIMIVAANPPIAHPPRGMLILEALKKRKTKLIVIDPQRTELADRADIWLQLRPGTDLALAMAMIYGVIRLGERFYRGAVLGQGGKLKWREAWRSAEG